MAAVDKAKLVRQIPGDLCPTHFQWTIARRNRLTKYVPLAHAGDSCVLGVMHKLTDSTCFHMAVDVMMRDGMDRTLQRANGLKVAVRMISGGFLIPL